MRPTLCYLIFFCLFFPLFLPAQTSLGLRLQSGQTGAHYWQPAYLAQQDMAHFQLGLDFDYGLGSNVLAYADASLQGFIDEEQKTRILNDLTDDNRLRAGIFAGAMVNIKLGGVPLSFSYRRNQSFFFRNQNPQTVGLILRGNAPYAGTTISEENLAFQNLLYSDFGLGTAFRLGKLQVGARLKLLQGQRLGHLQDLDFTFLTQADGTAIETSASYDWFGSLADESPHWGFGADLGLLYPVSERLELGASVLNLGAINWQGTIYQNEVSFAYSGLEIGNLLDVGDQDFTGIFAADSLRTLFFPDSSVGSYRLNLPAMAQVSAVIRPDSLQTIWGTVQYGFNPFAEAHPLPLFSIGYQREVAKNLQLGTQIALGGLEGLGWGVSAAWTLPFSDQQSLQLYYSLDNSLGALAPAIGKAIRMNGGLTLAL
jgi:hypothetical protein